MHKLTHLLPWLLLAAPLTISTARADIEVTYCFPSGAGMVPPVASSASVSAALTCDDASGHAYFTGQFQGLSGGGLQARLHGPADAGQDGPLILEVALGGGTDGDWDQELDLDLALMGALLAGRGYVVVTSGAYPGGEAREQLFPASDDVLGDLMGAQMVPPVNTQASGFVSLSVTPSSGAFSAIAWGSGLTGQATRISLHAPAWYGEVAPEVIGADYDALTGLLIQGTVTAEVAAHIESGHAYIVVHTDGYPDGELRAQTVDFGTQGSSFCASEPNSLGISTFIIADGSPVVAHGDLRLSVSPLPPNQWGYYLVGSGTSSSNPLGSSGRLCLGGGLIGRFASQVQNTGGTPGGWGAIVIDVDLANLPLAGGTAIQPGDTWNFQLWHRDLVNGSPTSNFSSALSIDFL